MVKEHLFRVFLYLLMMPSFSYSISNSPSILGTVKPPASVLAYPPSSVRNGLKITRSATVCVLRDSKVNFSVFSWFLFVMVCA